MSRTDLLTLYDSHAFDPAPRLDELYRYHVPFDRLLGTPCCEEPLGRALRRGEQLALVGDSGSGKSSVIAHVLGPLVEGVAPLPIPVAVEAPEVARDPVEFAGHLIRTVARYVQLAHPTEASAARALVERSGGTTDQQRRGRRFGGSIGWLAARLELATELQSVTSGLPRPSSEVFDHARAILDLIVAHGLQPILVFDDTDKWFGAAFDNTDELLDGFFGRIVRLLSEELSAPSVLAVHRGYLSHPAYQQALGFVETTIRIPAVPDAGALGEILALRAAEHGVRHGDILTGDALDLLFEHYHAGATSDLRRRVLFVAHTALAHACDDSADLIDSRHMELALFECSPEGSRPRPEL